MAVFRVERTKDYTVMSNYHLRDTGLSLTAKGLLSQMLSLPDNWDYTLAGLAQINREGKSAIRSAVNELEQAGYIRRRRVKGADGKFSGNEYIIHEQPVSASPSSDFPTLENPSLEKPTSENPSSENRTELNIDKSSKDLLEKENKEKADGKMPEAPAAPAEEPVKRKKAHPLDDAALNRSFVEFIEGVSTLDWSRDVKNSLYFALSGFYTPRESKKQEPSRTPTAVTTLLNRLARDSQGDPLVMIGMLERATISGWKSVFPPNTPGQKTAAKPPTTGRRNEEWL